MKYYVFLSCIVLLAIESSAKSDAGYHKFLNGIPPEIQTKCYAEADLTADKEKVLTDETTVDFNKLSCYGACVFKQSDIMVDGTIAFDKLAKLTDQIFIGDPTLDARKAILKECLPKMTGDTDCAKIATWSKCILEKQAEQGL